jgi:hypothetical protein
MRGSRAIPTAPKTIAPAKHTPRDRDVLRREFCTPVGFRVRALRFVLVARTSLLRHDDRQSKTLDRARGGGLRTEAKS